MFLLHKTTPYRLHIDQHNPLQWLKGERKGHTIVLFCVYLHSLTLSLTVFSQSVSFVFCCVFRSALSLFNPSHPSLQSLQHSSCPRCCFFLYHSDNCDTKLMLYQSLKVSPGGFAEHRRQMSMEPAAFLRTGELCLSTGIFFFSPLNCILCSFCSSLAS